MCQSKSLKRNFKCAIILIILLTFKLTESMALVSENMILIPAGEFIMGATENDFSASPDEWPKRKIFLNSFFIDKYEVTNEEYKKFVDSTGTKSPKHWKDNTFPEGKAKFPVYNVSWEDANKYANWVGKRLPTEEEWEKAARGTDERIYPWGNKFELSKVRTLESGDGRTTVEVGSYEQGKSPYGIYDMAGNVWEWTSSHYKSYDPANKLNNPYFDKNLYVIRGGSAHFNNVSARVTNRNINFPNYRYFLVGFRCAKSDE